MLSKIAVMFEKCVACLKQNVPSHIAFERFFADVYDVNEARLLLLVLASKFNNGDNTTRTKESQQNLYLYMCNNIHTMTFYQCVGLISFAIANARPLLFKPQRSNTHNKYCHGNCFAPLKAHLIVCTQKNKLSTTFLITLEYKTKRVVYKIILGSILITVTTRSHILALASKMTYKFLICGYNTVILSMRCIAHQSLCVAQITHKRSLCLHRAH